MGASIKLVTAADKKRYQHYLEETGNEEWASKLWLREKCQKDLFFLGAEIFGLKDAKDPKTKRKRLDAKMHKKMAAEMTREEDTLQLYPRLHMKSAWMKFYIIQRILRNPNVRIGFWSKTTSLVEKEMTSIKRFLENPLLKELFPDICVDRKEWEKDTAGELTMKRDASLGHVPDQAQIEAFGVGTTVTGNHYDYHIYDDVIDQDSVTTATQIEKVEDWYGYMQSIRDLGAIEKMIGTRYHMHDLYGYIMANEFFEEDNIVVEQAYNRTTGKVLYSFFTKKDLDRLRKRQKAYKFECQYMNNPVPQEDKIFLPPYPVYLANEFPADPKYYMSVDPAASATATSDETGIWIAAVDKKAPNKMFVVEAKGVKKAPAELADYIVAMMVKYRPVMVGIETGLQAHLQPLIDIKAKEWEGNNNDYLTRNYKPIPTKMGTLDKANKLKRTIGALIADKRCLLPGEINHLGNAVPLDKMKNLIYQMDCYNPRSGKNEDDIIDAGAVMCQTIEHFAPAHWFTEQYVGRPKSWVKDYTMKELMDMKPAGTKEKGEWGWNLAC